MLVVLTGIALAATLPDRGDIDLFPEQVLAPAAYPFPAQPLTSQQKLGKYGCWAASTALTGVAIGFKMAALEAEHDAKSNQNEYIEEQEYFFEKAEGYEKVARINILSGLAMGAVGGWLHYLDKKSEPPPPPERPSIREMPDINMEEDDRLKDGLLEEDMLEEEETLDEGDKADSSEAPAPTLDEEDFPDEPE